jgi:TetR/AcrR family transcriptional regulator, cholesterol catabolism regulator
MTEELKNIVEKVRVLYNKYGIKSITMDDVARELGISKKTLYQYVTDKNDLVNKVIQLDIEKASNEFDNVFGQSKNAIEELIDLYKMVLGHMKVFNLSTDYDLRKYYPDLYRQMLDARQNHLFEKVLSNLQKGKKQGLYRKELNEKVIAKLTVSRIFQMLDNDTVSVSEFTSNEFFTEVLVYHIRGIADEKGLKVLEQNFHKFYDTTKEE